MSNFENYDFILPDGVVIENEKADKEGRKKSGEEIVEVKEEFGTLSFNNVLLYREDTKMYQVIFLSLLNHTQGFYAQNL